MAGGKDTRFDSNRKVTKEAMGNRYVEIGVGFGDDPRILEAIKKEKEMWGSINPAKIVESVSEEDE